MALPVSPPARRVFAVMVFGGGAPRLIATHDGIRRVSRSVPLLREPLLLVAVGVIRRWSRKSSMLKKQGRIVETPTEAGH
jgi:hypothetical protein